MNNSHVRMYYDQIHEKWVAEFTTTIDGKVVPRAIRCKTQAELTQRLKQVNIDS